jgi:hypothetical protein
MFTKVRANKSSDMDTGETVEGSSVSHMVLAMEMLTALTSIAMETARDGTLQPMQSKEQRTRRWRREFSATAWAFGDWSSHMELGAQQQAPEQAQLHRTISKMAYLLETHTALQEVLW